MDKDNLSLFVKRIQLSLPDAADLSIQHLKNHIFEVDMVYLSSIVDNSHMNKLISAPFVHSTNFGDFEKVIRSYGAEKITEFTEIIERMLLGYVIVVYFSDIYCLLAKKLLNNSAEEIKTENTVIGPSKAFSEDVYMNLAFLRSRYKKQHLAIKEFVIGTSSKTKVLLVFDAAIANPDMIETVSKKLASIDVDMMQASGQLAKLLNKERYTLFPTIMMTERPDRAALNLAHGKAILLIEGTTFVLAIPAVFFDFMSAMDDLYESFWITRALVFLRYVALFITIVLPAIYVSVISYNPEIFRVQLTLSIAGSRAAVPYPSYVEVLIMLFMIEALIEASLRLPKFIGSAATTVGGLILGQAAQQAGLVSSLMIIVTSAVAISNFVIPINVMSFSMRFVKYVLILFAAFFGLVGVIAGLFLLVSYLSSLRSFGKPYLKIFFGEATASYPQSEDDSH